MLDFDIVFPATIIAALIIIGGFLTYDAQTTRNFKVEMGKLGYSECTTQYTTKTVWTKGNCK
jgi:hypothetical protein